jgi:hypothetical protein
LLLRESLKNYARVILSLLPKSLKNLNAGQEQRDYRRSPVDTQAIR